MDTLIYILKAHVLFTVLGGIYHFILKDEKSFSFNRFYLLAIYGVSLIIPLLEIKIFKNVTFINQAFLSNESAATASGGNSSMLESNLFTLETGLPLLYGILVFISIFIFIIKFIKSYHKFKLIQRTAYFDYKQQIYWVSDEIPPFTFLNKTLLPKKLQTDDNKDVIIKHEEVHRKTLHFFDIIWVEVMSSLLIFNPLNQKIKKHIVENHEFLADEYACMGVEKTSYAELLIQQTLKQNQFQFVSYFAKPTILNRLNMLTSNKKSTKKPFLVAFLLILFSFIFSCDLNPEEEIILKPKNENTTTSNISSNDLIDENTIFNIVEKQAEPPGGIQDFYNHLSKDLEGKYPQQAIRMGIEGVVYLQFVIERDGSLSNIQPVKGIGAGCDELAVKLLKNQGNWVPGKQKGKTVRSRRVIPIRFVLN
ncbi:M56 family metallopeptidase [uncultured Marivirga sp.]|uniref:M56 family metallopeptidase n=1 Tax=uncultured Marivirga sp. TaxID=1123707 RepID=UPI0030EF66BF|tara:strand:+ start:59935 stop:61200 length:1266 start_codon:yes stop_codon:yes gene_type:complete